MIRLPHWQPHYWLANGTGILTYGHRSVNLDSSEKCAFHQVTIVVDVPCHIIGVDFLHASDLLVGARRRIVSQTSLNLNGLYAIANQIATQYAEPPA